METRHKIGFAVAAGFFSNALLTGRAPFIVMVVCACLVATAVLAVLWFWPAVRKDGGE